MQEKIQHAAYIIDSLHLRCINASKDKHNEHNALKILSMPNDNNHLSSKKSILSDLFPRSSFAMSLSIPCVNFIALQVSSEGFCTSEASSLSGQCGSKFSNDFGFPRNTCAVAMVASMQYLKFSYLSNGEHKALQDLTVSLLRRQSVFRSNNDYDLLRNIHELTESCDEGLTAVIETIDCQLQRLDCENLAEDSSFVTAVPNVKSLVPFVVYRGDDVDVDDITWLEQKLSNPVGKIMLELGLKTIRLEGLFGKSLSLLTTSGRERSPEKKTQKQQYTVKMEGQEVVNSEPEHAVSICDAPSTSCEKISRGRDENEGDDCVDMMEPSIYVDHSESCSLLNEKDDNIIKSVVLEIQESIEGVNVTKGSDNNDTENSHQNINSDKGNSQIGKMKELDGIEKETKEYILKKRSQGEININKIWFNLAHPTKLKIFQEGSDYSVNLISSIVPSICAWIPVYVDLMKTTDLTLHNYRRHRYSVMAYVMGQALPDKGRLYIKVISAYPFIFLVLAIFLWAVSMLLLHLFNLFEFNNFIASYQ